jgi:hypothetical protein
MENANKAWDGWKRCRECLVLKDGAQILLPEIRNALLSVRRTPSRELYT